MRWTKSLALTAALLLAAPAFSADKPDIGLPTVKPEKMGFSSERLKALDTAMDALVDKGRLPGILTIVARHGKVVAVNVYGAKDTEAKAPLTADTIFRMYSQTKPVTAVAMTILFEEGKWKLDDPVTKFVPEFKNLKVFKGLDDKGQPILEPVSRSATMRELMTHTAGFAYGLVTDNPVDKAYFESGLLGSKNLDAMLGEATTLPLANQPGARWKYSIAVDIQGAIVERLSGQSLPDFMQSRIFGPLGMKDTGFYVPDDKKPRQAALYAVNPKSRAIVPAEGFMVLDVSKPPTMAMGGGGLVSTAHDYLRFAQMLANGGALDGVRILSPAGVKMMESNHLSDAVMAQKPMGPGMGFGFDGSVVMDPAAAGTLAGKGTYSWGGAAGTWFWVDPENDVVFLGMIQVLGWYGMGDVNLEHLSQTLVYSALVDPKK
ncbi:CubicO group peptidase (beta-lactamase class C family) [Caulobacter ginsengisoli]|uniref:CubicO group peptidase (Beta-lactamase class C family) n=1 Tax=Caulobacter ginsengisoli TaxID=400775 RepID=A0ABU0IQE7_9CAUL|nr:serine hydrolase domain-containing protein [Caulobacter ginsengisoli]MDQ0463244.1 CubicO group peptidase (beta-lactamase class C family) [Caulobacter ginsengisoli]